MTMRDAPPEPWPHGRGEMARRTGEHDWGATPLGPVAAWPAELRSMVETVLAHGFPMLLLWGDDLIQIYNAGYRPLMGDRHPEGFGRPAAEHGPETLPVDGPTLERVRAGETVTLEDTRFTVTCSPLRDETGAIAGVLVTLFEATGHGRSVADGKLISAVAHEPVEAGNIDVALRRFAELIGRHFGSSYCVVSEPTESGEAPFLSGGWNAPDAPAPDDLDWAGLLSEAQRAASEAGEPSAVTDTQAVPLTGEGAGKGLGLRSLVMVPVMREGRQQLQLVVADRLARAWDAREIGLLRELADRIWSRLEPARLRKRLRESEARFRAFVTASADVVYRMSPDWSEMRQLHGRAFIGDILEPSRGWLERYILPDDQAVVKAAIDQAVVGRKLFEIEHRVRRADGGIGWVQSRAVPIPGPDGEISEWLGTASDVTAVREAADALRDREALFRSFAENSTDVLWIVDADTGQLEYLSPSFAAVWGESRERVLADIGRWAELVHPDDRARAALAMPRTMQGEKVTQSYRILRPFDGAERWIQDTGFPIRDESGRIRRIGGIAQDLTERTNSELEVRAKRRELRILVETIPQLVWRAVDGGQWVWASPQWTKFTGQSDEDSHGWGWLAPIHPDDREAARKAWRKAESSGRFEADYRLRGKDGIFRWFQTRATAISSDDGSRVDWVGTSTDVDDIRRLQEHEELLLAELQHRVRNTLSVIRSIVRRTARTSESLDDYIMHLEGRIDAFARVQSSVARDPLRGVDLEYLIVEELRTVGGKEGDTFTIKGPKVLMAAKSAERLGLAIHELATNALKYGALTLARGEIKVRWAIENRDGDESLDLRWLEQGMSGLPAQPARRGFGTELLSRTLAYELKADVSLDFHPTGVECRIRVPLEQLRGEEAVKRLQ